MYKDDTIYYPQDEMNTFLLPVTRGCSYNKCKFCSMYKDDEYEEVSFADIEMELKHGKLYTEKIFLTGADPLAIGFTKMKKLLDLIKKHLPYCACVASYASIRSISKYTAQELSILHNKGLRLLYIGFESGRDDVLEFMSKSHRSDEAIKEAKKLNKAKLQFNSIVMYGIAGKGESVNNAIETAKMINQFETRKVITMNLVVMERSELSTIAERKEFISAGRKERLLEVKILLENLEVTNQMIFDTTHPTNIISIKGMLSQDKKRLLNEVERNIKD